MPVSLNCKIKSVFQIASVMNRHYKWEGETLILRDFNETENLNLKYWLKIVLNKNWSAETLYCVNCFWKKSCTSLLLCSTTKMGVNNFEHFCLGWSSFHSLTKHRRSKRNKKLSRKLIKITFVVFNVWKPG
jgi:hypothetical protein